MKAGKEKQKNKKGMKQIEYKLQIIIDLTSNNINLTLNVNRLKTPIKRQKLSDWIFFFLIKNQL